MISDNKIKYSEINNKNNKIDSGVLYIVATPIGNMDDITLRAIQILESVDLIAAEDTRKAKRLLKYHKIDKPIISCFEHNEKERSIEIIDKLKQHYKIAFVSDAGTPLISDPGFYLISKCIKEKISIIPIPGVCAAIAALSVSGLPTDSFLFIGFVSRKKNKREQRLIKLAAYHSTLIFYESPKRIIALLEDLIKLMGDRNCFMAREMTKNYEEFLYGKLSEILEKLSIRKSIKGEFTLLVEGYPNKKHISNNMLEKQIIELNKNPELSHSDIVKKISQDFEIPKKQIYQKALDILK